MAERKFGRGPARYRQIRQIGGNQKLGVPAFGITIPPIVEEQFRGVWFTIRCEDHRIILESGCKNG